MPAGPTSRLLNHLGAISYHLNAVVLGLAERHDLGPRGVWALRCIADGCVFPSEIADSMMVAPSLVTSDLKRLEKAGLAIGRIDGHDRRRYRFVLTETGRALLEEAYQLYETRVLRRLKTYDSLELLTFFKVLDDLSRERWRDADEEAANSRIRELEDELRRLRARIPEAGA